MCSTMRRSGYAFLYALAGFLFFSVPVLASPAPEQSSAIDLRSTIADEADANAFSLEVSALAASGRLLRTLRARFTNLGLIAAAYNAGPKRVLDWLAARASLPKETRDYVNLITGRSVEAWRNAKAKTVVFDVPRQVPCHQT